jgi:LEA14-like dessication related protein
MIRNGLTGGLVAALLVTVGLTGCAGLGPSFQVPEVRLAGLRVDQANFFETVMELTLRVINGNDAPLTLKGIFCELELNNKSVATGASKTAVAIPAFGSDTVTVTVYSSMFKIASSFFQIVQRGAAESQPPELSYQLSGRIHLEAAGLRPSSLPFKSTGTLSITDTFGKIVE